jgi:hypothetical protein
MTARGQGDRAPRRVRLDVETFGELVVAGWDLGAEGRKQLSRSAIWAAEGEVIARNLAIWIALTREQQAKFCPTGAAAGATCNGRSTSGGWRSVTSAEPSVNARAVSPQA